MSELLFLPKGVLHVCVRTYNVELTLPFEREKVDDGEEIERREHNFQRQLRQCAILTHCAGHVLTGDHLTRKMYEYWV